MDESDPSVGRLEMVFRRGLCQQPMTAGPQHCAERSAAWSSRRVSSWSYNERRRRTALSRQREQSL